MTKGKKILAGAGIVVVAGIGIGLVTARTQQPTASQPVKDQRVTPHHQIIQHHRKPAQPAPVFVSSATTPTIPSAGQSTAARAQASLASVTHKEGVTTPTGPIDVVVNLANPTQHWAFATEAAKGASTGDTLWFGEQNTPDGPWTWIPSTLPGALSSKLPPAVYSTLQWAWDLNQGKPGPSLFGTVSWNGITGHVGLPEGWTAQESAGQLTITTWAPSYTGMYAGFYGVQSVWDADTLSAGQSGLSMIVPGGTATLAQLVNP